MKTKLLLATLCLLGSLIPVHAQLTIPSDGTDGAFNPVANIEVDLTLATSFRPDTTPSVWSDNNSANAGNGVYDRDKWAVAFKYSSVNIPAGVTVTFKNHPSYAPVVWLVQGSVTIAGTVSVNGRPGAGGTNAAFPVEPGPGGFRGAAYGSASGGFGLGPGGGASVNQSGNYSSIYGNPQILPLIGGSGGAHHGSGISGNGGGGAILIAAPNIISVTGNITALGSVGATVSGSGGAVKLIANQVTGSGSLNCATTGRLRVEANSLSATIAVTPSTIAVAPVNPPTIFQSTTSPTVRIISVDGTAAPADPTAPLVTSADIGIQKSTPVTIVLETRRFSTSGAVVNVQVKGKFGGGASLNATLDAGGNTTLSTWRINTTMPAGFATIQAPATGP